MVEVILSDFLSPSPRGRIASAWLSHSSHSDASVLEGSHGNRGAGGAPAVGGIQAPVSLMIVNINLLEIYFSDG